MTNTSVVLGSQGAAPHYDDNGTDARPLGPGGGYNMVDDGGGTNHNASIGVAAPPEQEYNWPVLCLFGIVVMALCGNILVCISVRMEKKLQNMFNFFLVSLATSDMLSATLVMPLSIVKAFLNGKLTHLNHCSLLATCYTSKPVRKSH